MSRKEGTGAFGAGGSRPYHTKGGDQLGTPNPTKIKKMDIKKALVLR